MGFWKTSSRSGALSRISMIHLEYHHHIAPNDDKLACALRVLEQAGFGYKLRADAGGWGQQRGFQDISIFSDQRRFGPD